MSRVQILISMATSLVLTAPEIITINGSFDLKKKDGSTMDTLCALFNVPYSADIQLVADFVDLGGNYEDRVWSFRIEDSAASLRQLNINFQGSSQLLSWTTKCATFALPQLFEYRDVAEERWAGDLGKVFGRKKTKYISKPFPRALTAVELDAIRNHLTVSLGN